MTGESKNPKLAMIPVRTGHKYPEIKPFDIKSVENHGKEKKITHEV